MLYAFYNPEKIISSTASKCCGGLIGLKKEEADKQKICIAKNCSKESHTKNKVDWSAITTYKIKFSSDKNMFSFWRAERRISFGFT